MDKYFLIIVILISVLHILKAVQTTSSIPTATPTTTSAGNDSKPTGCYSDESCLYEQLMSGYNNQVRPVTGPSGTVNVNILLSLQAILALDEKNEVLQSVLSISASWRDRFLSWEDLRYHDIDVILINVKNLWLPDFAITNSVEKFYDPTYLEDFRAHVTISGDVIWRYGGVFKTSCNLDIRKYPFDEQTCEYIIQNWAYSADLVNLTEAEFITVHYAENSLWKLTSYTSKTESYVQGPAEFPRLTFTITLKRKTRYYVLNLILPTLFVMVAALGVFILPPDCGEKVSLGISVLLAFTVFQIVITSNTPVNSDTTPWISQGVLSVMGLASMSVLTSMLTVYLHYRGPYKRVPRWLRHVAFHVIGKIFCSKEEIPNIVDSKDKVIPLEENADHIDYQSILLNKKNNQKVDPAMTMTELVLLQVLREIQTITDTIKSQQYDELIKDEWKLLAKIIDRILLMCSLFVLLCVTFAMI